MVDPKILKKIVRFCNNNGILKYKSGDFEIELSGKRPNRASGTEIQESPAASFPDWDSLSPEQKVLWSATPDIEGPS